MPTVLWIALLALDALVPVGVGVVAWRLWRRGIGFGRIFPAASFAYAVYVSLLGPSLGYSASWFITVFCALTLESAVPDALKGDWYYSFGPSIPWIAFTVSACLLWLCIVPSTTLWLLAWMLRRRKAHALNGEGPA